MSAFLTQARSAIFKLISPSFYVTQYRELVIDLNKKMIKGDPSIFFKSLLLVGVVGYTQEYVGLGSKKKFIWK